MDANKLAQQKYVSVTSFERDGTPVATPVWVVDDSGKIAFGTQPQLGKVKRIRANPKVTIAPCTFKGKLLGEPRAGTAQLLSDADSARVRKLIKKKYGLVGWLTIAIAEWRQNPPIGIRVTLD
jgi:uncharacterized protein